MRSLAEQKGFTKFNAKKTARFIDKALATCMSSPKVISGTRQHHLELAPCPNPNSAKLRAPKTPAP